MATLLTKRSNTASSVPLAAQLTNSSGGAELAVNTADKRLYVKDSGGTVVELGISPGSMPTYTTGTANGVTYLNGSKVLTSGSALTFDGTNLGLSNSSVATVMRIDGSGRYKQFEALQSGTREFYVGYDSTNLLANIATDLNRPIAFSVAGVETMRLTSTGLGIGTSSPTARLTVQDSTSGNGTVRYGDEATDYGQIFYRKLTGEFRLGTYGTTTVGMTFLTGGTERMRLDSAGNLGLGGAPSAWSTSYKAIQMGGYASFAVENGAVGQALVGCNVYGTGTGTTPVYIRAAGAPSSLYLLDANVHKWYTAGSGAAGSTITFTQAMTLDSAGRLGVGTTSPSAALDVSSSGGVQFKLTSTSSSAGLQAFTSAGSFAVSAMDFTSSATIFYTGNGTAGSAERARIDSSGNLLVGQTSAATTGSGVWIYNQNSNQGRLNITKTASGTLNAIANYHSGTYIGGVDYSNTATSFPTSSDIRLKKDIEDAGDASEKVQQIRVVTHGWKHDDATVEFGVIAQELYAVAPQAVTPGDDGEEVERTWAVDYSKLVPMLIKAHQEQQALIQSLTQRIAALEGAQA